MSISITQASHFPRPDWARSKSQADSLFDNPVKSPTVRPAVDASSSRHSIHERDTTAASASTSTPNTKKRRSTTLTSVPTPKTSSRTESGLPRSPSVPSLQPAPDFHDSAATLPVPTPTSDSRPTTPTTPLLRIPSNASTTDSRSPTQRRPPASHSSYGVETSNGPPPSFTTQRTFSQDRVWKPSPLTDQSRNMGEMAPMAEIPPKQEESERTVTLGKRRSGSMDGRSGKSTDTLCTAPESQSNPPDSQSTDEGSKNSGSDDRKSEDIFLNIARADAGGQHAMSRSERRKSKVGSLYASLLGRQSNGSGNDAVHSHSREQDSSNRSTVGTELLYQPNKRHSTGPRSSAASAHPLDTSSRQRYFSSGSRLLAGATHSTVGRGDREISPESPHNNGLKSLHLEPSARPYRRSNLSAYRAERNVGSTEAQDRPRQEQVPARVESTNSTLSTTAPSTVWDELDELKSRIRKLELTGKLPPSSAAAMTSVERPQTATTTVTTVSSSPKYGKANSSQPETAIEGIPRTVHPLLHDALHNARPILSAEVYQKLEAIASDILQLAALVGPSAISSNHSTVGIATSSERHIRRRADSACRGLTELTIALSFQSKLAPPLQLPVLRPGSRDATSGLAQTPPPTSYSADSVPRYGRRLSNDPDEVRSTMGSRLQTRLDIRRTSLVHNSVASPTYEHAPASRSVVATPQSGHSELQLPPNVSGRLGGVLSSRRSHHPQEMIDGATDSENENSPSIRPVSRARTEVGLRQRSARDRSSLGREYISTHPLPSYVRKGDGTPSQRSPSVVGSLSGSVPRRTYASARASDVGSQINDPSTPKDTLLPAYRRLASGSLARDSPSASSYLSPMDHSFVTPDNVTVARGSASGSRRSLGLTSRLGQMGSFVNGRLRSVKGSERERNHELPATPEQGESSLVLPKISRHDLMAGERDQENVY